MTPCGLGAIIYKSLANSDNENSIKAMERYRSGHNEAVLKTVCPKGREGSNPSLSAELHEEVLTRISLDTGRSTQAVEGAPLERE